ncbi:MAG: hypothetical protein HFJ48_03410 [Clostridia bacterium]|nr:hypothetical protein [Clostridia bacterium]
MRSNKSKVITIVAIILIVLILSVGGTVAYLYLKTDVLKSNKELFEKYVNQTMSQIENVFENEKIEEMAKKLKENNSESKTVLTFEGPEGNAANLLSLSMDIKNDKTNKKMYNDVKLLNGEENLLEAEYMLTENSMSLRLTDIVKQFLTINDTNIEQLANTLNMETENLQSVLELLRYKDSSNSINLTNDEIKTLKETYSKIITSDLKSSNYTKQTDVMITVNGKTVTVNSYILTIKPEQYKIIIQKVLEQLKNDTIILNKLENIGISAEGTIKQKYIENIDNMLQELETIEYQEDLVINVYEENGKTIRIKLEEGFYTIVVDTIENDEILGVNTKITALVDQVENAIEVDLTKYKSEYYDLSIELKNIDNDEQSIIFEVKAINNEKNMKLEFSAETIEEEKSAKALITSNIQFVDQVEDMIILVENTNDIILNNLTPERCNQILQTVRNAAINKYSEEITRIMSIMVMSNLPEMSQTPESPEIPNNPSDSLKEAEKAAFNAKFEAFEGVSVNGAQANTLIRTVLDNNTAQTEEDKKVSITGAIELKTIDKTMPEIGANVGKTYTVVLNVDTETGFVRTISITEN